MELIRTLPSLNALLNASSALLLLAGFVFIRRKQVEAHRLCMLGAVASSTLFLISYLVYHWQAGSVRFQGQGMVRTVYFAILISHTLLAMAVPPMALVTLARALKGRFEPHRWLARRTLPVWLYVSATGVTIYLMLYQWFPGPPGGLPTP